MCAWVSRYTQPSQTHGGCPLQPSPKGQVPSLPAHISCLNRASKSEPHLHQDPGAEARALRRSLRARGPTVLQWALGLPCGVRGNGGRLGLGWQLLSGGCWVTKSGRGRRRPRGRKRPAEPSELGSGDAGAGPEAGQSREGRLGGPWIRCREAPSPGRCTGGAEPERGGPWRRHSSARGLQRPWGQPSQVLSETDGPFSSRGTGAGRSMKLLSPAPSAGSEDCCVRLPGHTHGAGRRGLGPLGPCWLWHPSTGPGGAACCLAGQVGSRCYG